MSRTSWVALLALGLALPASGCFLGDKSDDDEDDDEDEDEDDGGGNSSDACDVAMECLDAFGLSEADQELYLAVFGEDGECWTSTAVDCDENCLGTTLSLHTSDYSLQECWPHDGTPDAMVFSTTGTWDFTSSDCLGSTAALAVSFSASDIGTSMELDVEYFQSGGGFSDSWSGVACEMSGTSIDCESYETSFGDIFEFDFEVDGDLASGTANMTYSYEGEEYTCELTGGT